MPRPNAARLPVLLVAVALVLAACGGADPAATSQAASPSPSVSASAEPSEASASASASESAEPTEDGSAAVEVTVGASSFSPNELTVPVGTTVTFINDSGFPHTVTHGSGGRAADDPAFDRSIGDGATVNVTFDEPGTFDVTCKIHPSMQMTVIVEG